LSRWSVTTEVDRVEASQPASDTCSELNTGYMCNVAVVQYELWKCTDEMWNMKLFIS